MGDPWGYVGVRGWLWLFAALAAAATLWFAGLHYASQPSYTPVAAGLAPGATANATALLDRNGIRWELENAGRTLAVDSARSADARRLLAGRVAGTGSTVAGGDPLSAGLQKSLDGMLRTVLGPGRAYVTVNATLDRNPSTSTSLAYARGGSPLTAQRSSASGSGYSASGSNIAWGRGITQTTTAYAVGGVQQMHVALLIDSSVPKATVAQLKSSVAGAAGIAPGRGDTLSVAQVRFPAPPAARASAARLDALVKPALAYGPFALLGLGLLGAAAGAARRREQEAL